ncbi:hypothetical protein D3C77_425230 [compost metagenome]
MAYPGFLKKIAMCTPVLSDVLVERDRLRGEISFAGEKLNMIQAAVTSSSVKLDLTYKKIEAMEAAVKSVERRGYCHCCRQETDFEILGDWLRDQYLCVNCSSIPRQRHIQYVMDKYFSGWGLGSIHESSPSNDFISRYCERYSSSQYFEGVKFGELVGGVRCENLEALTFNDDSFDLFITQDVFEHIFNPELAAKEIMRVLKPGGAHIFTAPKHKHVSLSYPRARLAGANIEYMVEPEYHGNPIGDGRALVTWDYGDDFESLIGRWSDSSTTTYLTRDRLLGLDGEYLEVFVIRKAAVG